MGLRRATFQQTFSLWYYSDRPGLFLSLARTVNLAMLWKGGMFFYSSHFYQRLVTFNGEHGEGRCNLHETSNTKGRNQF